MADALFLHTIQYMISQAWRMSKLTLSTTIDTCRRQTDTFQLHEAYLFISETRAATALWEGGRLGNAAVVRSCLTVFHHAQKLYKG